LTQIQPSVLWSNNPPDWGAFTHRFIAQGDSWFSIGAVPFSATTNVLAYAGLPTHAAVVNCADPGYTLKRMLDRVADPVFQQLLFGAMEHSWDGILISGLGNDLIDALSAKASAPVGARLLLTTAEWGPIEDGPVRYLSQKGWAAFKVYALALYKDLDQMRQRSKTNTSALIITHTYDLATPRNAPAGPAGPWLFKALTSYTIPPDDWCGLANLMLGRLSDLLCNEIAQEIPNMHVIKTQGLLTPAPLGSKGKVGHWANEIHPSNSGYKVLGKTWSKELQTLYANGK
jgi:hypothetical protein